MNGGVVDEEGYTVRKDSVTHDAQQPENTQWSSCSSSDEVPVLISKIY